MLIVERRGIFRRERQLIAADVRRLRAAAFRLAVNNAFGAGIAFREAARIADGGVEPGEIAEQPSVAPWNQIELEFQALDLGTGQIVRRPRADRLAEVGTVRVLVDADDFVARVLHIRVVAVEGGRADPHAPIEYRSLPAEF